MELNTLVQLSFVEGQIPLPELPLGKHVEYCHKVKGMLKCRKPQPRVHQLGT